MITLLEIINEIISYTKDTSDKSSMFRLIEFLDEEELNGIFPVNFNDKEFNRFINYLSPKGVKVTYNMSTRARRLLNTYDNNNKVFKLSPKLWKVPPKPKPKHFNSLSEEKQEILQDWAIAEIKQSIAKEKLVQNAIRKGIPYNLTGDDFWQRGKKSHKSKPRFSQWQLNLSDVIATIYSYYPDYPINKNEHDTFSVPYSLNYDEMNHPLVTLMKRFSCQKLSNFQLAIKGEKYHSFNDVMAYLYPDDFEITAIKIAISLQTGWTRDIIERIDSEDYLYDAIPIDGDRVFIMASKVKGANSEKSQFREQRTMVYPCLKSDPYSIYNLILLLKKRTARLRTGENYKSIVDILGYEPLCIHLNQNTKNINVAHPALRSKKYKTRFNTNKTELHRKLSESIGFTFDFRELRPTKLYIDEKYKNIPLGLQVALFGHSSSAITDGVYKDNPAFSQIRKDDLAKELNEIASSISDGTFKGKLIPIRELKPIKKRIINIYTNHSGESPLAVCNDPYYPDWKPELKGIRQDKPCRKFDKCLLCSKSSVFSDNIPFIVDRKIYLDQKQRSIDEKQFKRLYLDELNAIIEVIENYPYKEEISEAELRCATEGFLLPPIISELGKWD